MFNHWEIHEVEGHLVFVEISIYSSRCLYMDSLCEQVVRVEVINNLSHYQPNTEKIEEKGGEIYDQTESTL